MKKKTLLLMIFAGCIVAGVCHWRGKIENVSVENKNNRIVIDAGHPAASLGTENKVSPCVSIGDAI